MSSSPKHMKADVQLAINKCESLGSGKQLILHGNPSAIAKDFSPHVAVPQTSFFAEYAIWVLYVLQDALGGKFDIFAASGESTAWKTRSRPIGVRVCLVVQFNPFSTSFDPCAWTMIVFWKENSGRQPQIITSENERGDETNCTSPPTFFDDPDVPFGPSGPPGPPELPGPPGPPPGWPPVSGGRVGPRKNSLCWLWFLLFRQSFIHVVSSADTLGLRNLFERTFQWRDSLAPLSKKCVTTHQNHTEFISVSSHVSEYLWVLHKSEPQLIPIPMSDDDDDQPPQEERSRWRSRSHERTSSTETTRSTNGYSRSCWDIRWRIPRYESFITIVWTTAICWTERSLKKGWKIEIAWANTSTFICAGYRWKFSNRGSTKS